MTNYLPVTVAFQQIFHLASMSRTKANLAKQKQPLAKRWWLYNLMLLQVQLIIDKLSRMQESQIKKIAKDAPFFQPTKFKEFEADITSFKIPIKPKNISQLFLKSYGYGYFDEAEAPVQTQMKTNFLIYLQQALKQCTSLKTLKIQFNGYSIRDKSLLKIIRLIEDLIVRDNRDIETIWIHTRLLRDCDKTMVEQLLSLTDTLLRGKKFQQISLQISGWEFVSGPLPNKDFSELFGSFAHNIMPMADHNLKRLKIDISSLYMNQLQSYNFLKDAVPQDQLIESIQNSRFDERLHGNIKNSNLRQDRINQYREEIVKYLQCIDSKYAIEHPIPGKSKFISREPEYQKRKKEYIQKMIEKVSKEDLLKVFNQERSMPEQHKNALKQIRSNVDQEMDEQAKRIQQGQELIKTTNDIQRHIGEKFIKFPFDFVVAQRIQAFHKAIRAFVGELLERLTKLEEFELDMCHWNGNFQMGQLKKSLTKGFSQGGVKPVLNQASKILPRNLAPANEEEGNKLKCKFIM